MSGNIFNNTEKIIATDAIKIQNEIIEKLSHYIDRTNIIKIGSIGKHTNDHYHGDIDLAIKCNNFNELSDIVYKAFPDDKYIHYINSSKNLYLHSIQYEYINFNNEIKYVQVDFILSTNIDYTKFRYFCPDYTKENTKYKVYARILLLSIILNNCDTNTYSLTPIGLYNKHTKLYITNVNDIMNMMFNSDININDISTVEKIWNIIHSDKFKHSEYLKNIEKAFFIVSYSQPWEELNIYPEDFTLTYWTNEDINSICRQLDDINNINLELIKLQKQ